MKLADSLTFPQDPELDHILTSTLILYCNLWPRAPSDPSSSHITCTTHLNSYLLHWWVQAMNQVKSPWSKRDVTELHLWRTKVWHWFQFSVLGCG